MHETIFIDFEASSLDLISSYPIEVGIGSQSGAFGWLIRPVGSWRDWSEDSEAVHGISKDRLQREGLPVREVCKALNDHIREVCFCDAYTFDQFWLTRLFRAAGIQPTFRLESVVELLTPRQAVRWPVIRRAWLSESGIRVHRAVEDARTAFETWRRVTGQVSDDGIRL